MAQSNRIALVQQDGCWHTIVSAQIGRVLLLSLLRYKIRTKTTCFEVGLILITSSVFHSFFPSFAHQPWEKYFLCVWFRLKTNIVLKRDITFVLKIAVEACGMRYVCDFFSPVWLTYEWSQISWHMKISVYSWMFPKSKMITGTMVWGGLTNQSVLAHGRTGTLPDAWGGQTTCQNRLIGQSKCEMTFWKGKPAYAHRGLQDTPETIL